MTTKREELAWAAGLFDGEGWVGMTTNQWGNAYVAISVGQNDRRVLDRFQDALGGLGKVVGPYGIKRIYFWRTGKFEHAQATMAMLWNFLSPVKTEQFRKAFEAYHGRHIPSTT